jgi:large subunit ribosomal protein L19
MKNPLISVFEKRILKDAKKHPSFRSGDTIRVHFKIQEGTDATKFRVQLYEGVVTRFRKGTTESTFTVRKISAGGIGVERVFPLYSPMVDRIEVIAQGRVRRSRLYYLRDLAGKAARIKSRYVASDASVAQ